MVFDIHYRHNHIGLAWYIYTCNFLYLVLPIQKSDYFRCIENMLAANSIAIPPLPLLNKAHSRYLHFLVQFLSIK